MDVVRDQAAALQRVPIGLPQVKVLFPWPRLKKGAGMGANLSQGGDPHLGSDFKALGSHRGADAGDQVGRPAVPACLHRLDELRRDPCHRGAPGGVGEAYGPSVWISHQDQGTIGALAHQE